MPCAQSTIQVSWEQGAVDQHVDYTLEDLDRILRCRPRAEKMSAIEELGVRATPQADHLLARCLTSTDHNVVRAAIETIAKVKTFSLNKIDLLLLPATSSDATVSKAALSYLGSLAYRPEGKRRQFLLDRAHRELLPGRNPPDRSPTAAYLAWFLKLHELLPELEKRIAFMTEEGRKYALRSLYENDPEKAKAEAFRVISGARHANRSEQAFDFLAGVDLSNEELMSMVVSISKNPKCLNQEGLWSWLEKSPSARSTLPRLVDTLLLDDRRTEKPAADECMRLLELAVGSGVAPKLEHLRFVLSLTHDDDHPRRLLDLGQETCANGGVQLADQYLMDARQKGERAKSDRLVLQWLREQTSAAAEQTAHRYVQFVAERFVGSWRELELQILVFSASPAASSAEEIARAYFHGQTLEPDEEIAVRVGERILVYGLEHPVLFALFCGACRRVKGARVEFLAAEVSRNLPGARNIRKPVSVAPASGLPEKGGPC